MALFGRKLMNIEMKYRYTSERGNEVEATIQRFDKQNLLGFLIETARLLGAISEEQTLSVVDNVTEKDLEKMWESNED